MAKKEPFVNVKIRPESVYEHSGPSVLVTFTGVGHSARKALLAQLLKQGAHVFSVGRAGDSNTHLVITPSERFDDESLLSDVFELVEKACSCFDARLIVRSRES